MARNIINNFTVKKILPFLTKLVFFLIAILFLILFSCKIFKFQRACSLLGIFGNNLSVGVSLDPSLYDEKNEIKLFELLENGNNFIVIKSPEKLGENMTYVLPNSLGESNFVLTWQDGNIMQWKDVTSISGLKDLIQVMIKDANIYQGSETANNYGKVINDTNLQSDVIGVLPLEHGGSGSSLDEPSGDRIMFWDESKGRVRWLEVGDNLDIEGDSLNSETISSNTSTSYTGEIYTAGNGLYVSGSQVRLGGSLVQNTTISQGSFNMIYNLSGSGDFDVQDNGISVLKVTDSGLISVGVVTPGAFLDIRGSDSSVASLRIRSGVEPTSPVAGDIYSDGSNIYFWNGSSWDDLTEVGSTGDTLPLGTEGQLLYNNDGVWQAFNGMFWDDGSSYLGLGTTDPQYKLDVVGTVKSDVIRTSSLFLSGTEVTSTASELNVLHGISSDLTSDELSILDGVLASASEINTLYGVNPTLTSGELNILDGALVSTSELNVLYGVNTTLTSAELNILDGAIVSTSEINILHGALVSTSELNLLVGRSGVLIDSNNISSYAVTPSNIGSYGVTSVIAGSGLSQATSGPGEVTLDIGAGNGIYLDTDSISLDIATSGTFSSTSSFSGLELNSSGLSLLGGCSDDEVLAWDTDTDSWNCSSKLALGGVTGSGTGISTEGQITIWNGNSTITGSNNLWFESDTVELGIGTTNPLKP